MEEKIYNYEKPEIEIIEISVEKGFGGSDMTGGGEVPDAGGSDDFGDL